MLVVWTAAVACSSSGSGRSRATTTVADTERGGGALIDAFRRSMTTTWKVDEQFDRTTPSGGHIQAVQRRAQRPPDHLTVAGGTVDARAGDHVLACATGSAGALTCRDAGAARPYTDEVAAAVGTLQGQVTGNNRLYDVTDQGAGCFALHLRVPQFVAPPFGTDARLCYDGATGAPIRTEISRPEGRDVTVATSVSGVVADADLAPPPG